MMRDRLEAARALAVRRRRGLRRDRRHRARPAPGRRWTTVFGREQRVSTITVVRSAATGHKAINRGPVNVTDFVARVREGPRPLALPRPRPRARPATTRAYSTWLENPRDPLARRGASRRSPAHARACSGTERDARRHRALRHRPRRARRALRPAALRGREPQGAAPSSIARGASPIACCRLERPGRKDLVLRGGNRVLFLADKVARASTGAACSSSR